MNPQYHSPNILTNMYQPFMQFLRKNTPFIFLLILVSTSISFSQDNEVGGIRFGYNRAAVFHDGNQLSGTENLQSFYVGFFRDNKIVPLLYFGKGLEYVQNGYQLDNDNKLVLHYLSVPLNLKAKVGPVFGLVGIAPSIKISEKVFVDGDKSTPEDKSKGFDAPVFVGGGVKFLFITIEARYHWGLIEIDDGLRNHYFQLGAGLSF